MLSPSPNILKRGKKMVDSISTSTLLVLPVGRFVRLDHNVANMDGVPRTMIAWWWRDAVSDGGGVRYSYFDLETGRYEGECMPPVRLPPIAVRKPRRTILRLDENENADAKSGE